MISNSISSELFDTISSPETINNGGIMAAREQQIGYTVLVSADRIFPKPGQPRTEITDEEIEEFSKTIKTNEQLEPVILKVLVENGKKTTFPLIAGERRGSSWAVWGRKVWGVVRIVRSEAEHFRAAAISNISPKPLSAMDAARALARVQNDYRGMSQTELGEVFGKSQVWVSKHLAMLRLAPEVQAMLSPKLPAEKRLGAFAAAALAPLSFPEQIREAKKILNAEMNTTEALEHIRVTTKRLGVNKERRAPSTPKDDQHLLFSFLRGVETGESKLLLLSDDRFDKMFATMTETQRLVALRSIQKRFDSLGLIQARVKYSCRPGNVARLKLA